MLLRYHSAWRAKRANGRSTLGAFRARAFQVGAVLAVSLAAIGCTQAHVEQTWVGRAQGSDEVIALVEQDGDLRAYVCGGASTYQTHTRWYGGTLDSAGQAQLIQDDWVLETTLRDGEVTAKAITPEGDEIVFSVRPTADLSEGLYGVVDSGCRTGVILQTDPEGVIFVQGAWCDSANHAAQVTPVLPLELQQDRLHVQVNLKFLGIGIRDLYAERVREP